MGYYKKKQQKINGLWYPQSVLSGSPISTDKVADRLAEISTVSRSDVLAVLGNLAGVMADYMALGKSVKLDGLGTFYFTAVANGTGVETPEEVNANQITGVRVRFIPETKRTDGNRRTYRSLTDIEIEWLEWKGNEKTDEPEITDGTDGSTGAKRSTATRGRQYLVYGKNILLLGEDGEAVGIIKLINELEVEEVITSVAVNTRDLVVFTIPEDLAEGKYRLVFETYYSPKGLREEPAVVEAPFTLQLV